MPVLIVLLALGSPLQAGQINAWINSFRVADQAKPLALAAQTTYWLAKMMALGGVTTGSLKAHEQLIVSGIMRSRSVNKFS